jgi:hypothetical protein
MRLYLCIQNILPLNFHFNYLELLFQRASSQDSICSRETVLLKSATNFDIDVFKAW